jgi:SpoVK/Ycf46/Vps4 family AAA+-type ATPase
MDSLFRERYDDDNVVHRNLKTEFMSLWDQVLSAKCSITIIGATNRPQELDPAIQRRFERSYLIGIPDFKARKEIFKLVLRNTILESKFSFSRCAEITENYSPSDIIAVCKAASYIPYRELKKSKKKKSSSSSSSFRRSESSTNPVIPTNLYEPINENNNNTNNNLRPLQVSDIENAVQNVFPTAWASQSYGELTKNNNNNNEYWYNNDINNMNNNNNRTPNDDDDDN